MWLSPPSCTSYCIALLRYLYNPTFFGPAFSFIYSHAILSGLDRDNCCRVDWYSIERAYNSTSSYTPKTVHTRNIGGARRDKYVLYWRTQLAHYEAIYNSDHLPIHPAVIFYRNAQSALRIPRKNLSKPSQFTCMATSVQKSSCELPLNSEMTSCIKGSCTIKEALTTKDFSETAFGGPIRDHTKASESPSYLSFCALSLDYHAVEEPGGWTTGRFSSQCKAKVHQMPVLPLTGLTVVRTCRERIYRPSLSTKSRHSQT
ncbi:uncharacterized protein BDR25DRAFT_391552 [Lindgomyces ingoldianus]|uniref:Uncharacterized protein n=1 Tax=Lindgomyces ingoldianus TaxID=673940 RepID=A0ACB6RAE0_9PLEO|nr:uncharacterized protein BDR25DRAFT_391552 [Lindgomyces ingoldianus]KAF2475431.1 hypothetical protein BDR25DRAFT_391552 [Lindgomyces ingoldianus]